MQNTETETAAQKCFFVEEKEIWEDLQNAIPSKISSRGPISISSIYVVAHNCLQVRSVGSDVLF